MITRITSSKDDTAAGNISKKVAQEGSNVKPRMKTEIEVDSDVQPNYTKRTDEGLDAQPESKTAAQEDSNATLRIKTEANGNSNVQPKSKTEEQTNLQQKSETPAQEGFCGKQKFEAEHSSPIDTFKNQLDELIELEVSLSESAQLGLKIANKQVC